MAQRVSVPAVVTAILAAVASIGGAISVIWNSGQTYGMLVNKFAAVSERLGHIERKLDSGQAVDQDALIQLKLLDARVQALERTNLFERDSARHNRPGQ